MLQSTTIVVAGRRAAKPLPAWILTATLRLPWGRLEPGGEAPLTSRRKLHHAPPPGCPAFTRRWPRGGQAPGL